jgi:hypothetical protein
VTTRRDGVVVPVQGAELRLAGVRTRTDARGHARLRKRYGFLRPGRYRLRVTHPGFRAASLVVRAR